MPIESGMDRQAILATINIARAIARTDLHGMRRAACALAAARIGAR